MIAGTLEIQMLANMARLQADMDTAKRSVSGAMANIESAVGSAKSVLASLGIGLGVGYFANLIKGSIDAADHLNDLSKSTNMAVGDLAGLKLLAKQTGTDLDGLANGILKMSVNIGKDPAKFKALGVTAKDSAGQFKQLADIFNLLPDINQRNALSAAVFSKSWKEMAPALSEGSQKIGETMEKGKRLSGITDEMTKAADEFNDKWVELTGTGGLLTRQIAPLLPLLNVLADDMLAAQNKSTDLTVEFHPLAEAFRAAVILGGNVAFVMKAIGTEAGGVAAQLAALASIPFAKTPEEAKAALAAFHAIGEAMKKDAADNRAAFDEWEKKILAVGTATKATGATVKTTSGEMTAEQKKAAAAAAAFLETQKELNDAYKSLKKSLIEKIAAQEAELAVEEKLNPAQKEYAQFLASITAGTLVLTQAAMRDAAVKWDQYLALTKLNDEKARSLKLEEAADARWVAAADSLRKNTQATIDGTQAMRDSTAEMNLTEDALLALRRARIDDEIAAQQRLLAILTTNDVESANTLAIRANIAALEDRKKALGEQATAENLKKQIDEWKRFSEDIERNLTDALMRGFESGKDFGKSFVDSLKNTLKTAALKIAVQAIVSPVMGAVAGMMGFSGAANAFGTAGGASNMLSMGSSLSNLGGISAGYASFATSGVGSALGLGSATAVGYSAPVFASAMEGGALLSAGSGTAAGGLTAAGASFGAAIPYIGLGIAALSLMGAFDGGGEDPHNNTSLTGYELGLKKAGVYGVENSDATGRPSYMTAGATTGEGWWADSANLSAEQIKAINAQVATTFAQGHALARLFGADPSVVDTASVDSRRAGTPGNGHIQGYFSSMEQAFDALGGAIALKIIPNLKDFTQAGETLAQTASRLTQEFTLTNSIAAMMGKDGGAVFGGTNLKARDQLIQSLGGLSTASTTVGSYYQAYHSETERAADARGNISATLRALGVSSLPGSREQFRSLVEGQDLATEAGRTMYATLLSVADAFAGVTQSAEDAVAALGTARFRTRADYIYAQKTGMLPAYADGGDHDGGWAVVGERGRELAYMPPAHVYSNADSKALVDLTPVTAAIETLRADLRAVNAVLARAGNKTSKVLEKWDDDGMPAVRVL